MITPYNLLQKKTVTKRDCTGMKSSQILNAYHHNFLPIGQISSRLACRTAGRHLILILNQENLDCRDMPVVN